MLTQFWFQINVCFQNAWVDGASDSRNLASQEFIINVENVADSPPIFLSAPPVTRSKFLSNFVKILSKFPSPGCLRTVRSGTLWQTSWLWTGTRGWADPSDTSWTQSENQDTYLTEIPNKPCQRTRIRCKCNVIMRLLFQIQ